MTLVENPTSYSIDQLIEQFDNTLGSYRQMQPSSLTGGQVFEGQQTPIISVDQLTQQFGQIAVQSATSVCPYCVQRNTINHKQKQIKKTTWIRSRNLANRIAKNKWINNHGYLSGSPISQEIREDHLYLRSPTLTYHELGIKTLYSLFSFLLKHPEIPFYRNEFLGQDGFHYIIPINLETIINDHYGPINITLIPDQPIEQKHQFHNTCYEHTCPRCFRMKSSKKDICWMCKKCDKMIKFGLNNQRPCTNAMMN